MRRLLVLVSSIVAVDTIFYAVLTPLLPHYADKYGLSKAEAGMLVASYGAGALLAGLPAGLAASRLGPKKAALIGLCVVAAASLGFALADSAWTLGLARFCQGLGSVFSWAGALAWLVSKAPRERRGVLIGSAMGAAVFGALLGPVLGAVASVVGVRPAFVVVTLLALGLVAWAGTTPGAPPQPQRLGDAKRIFGDFAMVGGMWLVVLPALMFGVLIVLVSLRLDGHGWGPVAIGALFLGVTALEVGLNPLLGRFTDRHGRLVPVRAALLASALVSLGLAWARSPALIVALTFAAGLAYGAFYTPGVAIVADGAERLGLAHGLAFGFMNAAWAVGAVAGPAAGGALADAAGDALPYFLLAAICAATLIVLRLRPPEPVSAQA
ncbi:MAG: MFS transporter [Actinomycetota bacterium]|nr:MFS transporter [Actinomycetota bacterium]